METLRVGQPLIPGIRGYEVGVHYNFTAGGHSLRMVTKDPTAGEVQSVQQGRACLALTRKEDVIFILSRFGDLPWKVAHYNWWINPPVMRPDPWDDERRLNGRGVQMSVCLVNATDGLVQALRAVRLSEELSSMLMKLVQNQMRPPFDPWRYLEVVNYTLTGGINIDDLLRGAVGMCVGDLPPWNAFGDGLSVAVH